MYRVLDCGLSWSTVSKVRNFSETYSTHFISPLVSPGAEPKIIPQVIGRFLKIPLSRPPRIGQPRIVHHDLKIVYWCRVGVVISLSHLLDSRVAYPTDGDGRSISGSDEEEEQWKHGIASRWMYAIVWQCKTGAAQDHLSSSAELLRLPDILWEAGRTDNTRPERVNAGTECSIESSRFNLSSSSIP
jgi:hypothetical protein